MNPWWVGLPSGAATVDCAEHSHRLRWDAGKLRALDHDDIESERTLAALGGQRCACVDVLDAWQRHADDLRVLVLASRGPADPLRAQRDPPAARRPGPHSVRAGIRPARTSMTWSSYAPFYAGFAGGRATSAGVAPDDELVTLLGLGGALPDRLFATVTAGWAQQLERGGDAVVAARAALHAALYGRVAAAVRTWLGQSDAEVEVRMLGESEAPSLTEAGGAVHAAVPFGWLVGVWAKGLANVGGRFCLAATSPDGRHWKLSTVAPDLGPPLPVKLELPATG